MKLLLSYPPVNEEKYDKTRDLGVSPPINLLALAAYLREKKSSVKIKILDGCHLSLEHIKKEITSWKPDLVGFNCDLTNYRNMIELAKFSKNNKAHVILGGHYSSFLSNNILKNHKEVDAVVYDDGEESLLHYIKYLEGKITLNKVPNLIYREKDKIIHNPVKCPEIKTLPTPAYDLVDFKPYFKKQQEIFGKNFRMMQFYSQKGCVNIPHCVFCGRFEGGIRYRSPEAYSKEILYYIKKYNLTEIWDRSDSLLQSEAWFKKAHDFLIIGKNNPFLTKKVTFKSYARADQLLNDEIIRCMKDLNFRMIFIGYEAGDNRILKNINKKETITQYLKATKNCLTKGIDVDGSFIVGLPGENKKSLQNHINFVKRLIKLGFRKIRVNRVLVLPGTPLFSKVIETFPELKDIDVYDNNAMQRKLFQTDLYDLKEFGNSVDIFIDQIDRTADEMRELVLEAGGSAEGYGYGAKKSFIFGGEIKKKK